MTGPLTPEREQEIRERLERMKEPGVVVHYGYDPDVPILLAALDAARAERDEMEGRYVQAHGDGESARREVTALRAERDEYRATNETVRVCAEHVRDVVGPPFDCLVCEVEALREERDEMERRYINAHDDGDRARKALHDERCEVAALREALGRIVNLYPHGFDAGDIARAALAGGENQQ